MEEDKYWNIIENSWTDSPLVNSLRKEALRTNKKKDIYDLTNKIDKKIKANYIKRLELLSKEEYQEYICWFDEKLYKIDRKVIYQYTDGGDDGFIYVRMFIVGMGKEYYSTIKENPEKAYFEMDAESFGFQMYETYFERFKEEWKPCKYRIDSFMNKEGWEGVF